MKDSKWTWRFVCLISLAATLTFIVGFGYAVKDIVYPQGDAPLSSLPQKTGAPAEEVTGVLNVIALGDSLAKGTGDNTGEGFVKRAVTVMSTNGQTANLLGNLGINGLTTLGLQSALQEEGVQYAIRQANTILVSIGGNDLFRGAGIVQNADKGTETTSETPASQGELTSKELLAALPEASKRLKEVLTKISELNPSAKIYYLGLYNPFGDIPDLLVPGNQAVAAWNNAAMDIINSNSNMTLVPTFDLFQNHLLKYLSNDHFHPNGDGYQRIAERIVQAVQ